MKIIEIDPTELTNKRHNELLDILSTENFRTKGDLIYLSKIQWSRVKYQILKKAKKFKAAQISLVEFTSDRVVIIIPPGHFFDDTFDEMERLLS